MPYSILITDPIEDVCIETLRASGFTVDLNVKPSPEKLLELVRDADGMIVRSGTQVTAEVIGAMRRMRIIGRAGAGVDNIDVDAATRRGIIVMNTPGGNTLAAAELTIAMMVSLARKIPQACALLKAGTWDRKGFIGMEVTGKTLGVIGIGRIGREVSLRMKAFGMHVIGYDPLLTGEVLEKIGIKAATLEEIYRSADIITVHVPMMEETKGMISTKEFALMKDGVRIINCARGGIIDEVALLKALLSGKVAGAALDSFVVEPPPKNDPLIAHPNVIVTPHIGAQTEEAQENVARQIAEQFIDAFSERTLVGAVNGIAGQFAVVGEFKPYLTLAERLGELHAQLTQGVIKEVSLRTVGDPLHRSSELLLAACVKGLMAPSTTETVNYINALAIARERGITLSISREEGIDYTQLLTVRVVSEHSEYKLSGTAFGMHELRIVRFDDFAVEIDPEGIILLYHNIDRPGMLAAVSSILAGANINIANVALGRLKDRAITVMKLDSMPTEATQKELLSITGVTGIHVMEVK